MNMKKLFLLNLPYLLFVYPFDKLAQAFRLAPGADLSGKLLSIGDGFTAVFSSPWLSFHPTDLLIGITGAVVLRMAVYLKGKNAKKYRHGIEYGSARWGTAADIAPYMDKDFFQNIPMTQTERITMASRPKQPKYARNKNILVIGGSGSGKTRFFCKPSLLQAHSSYVCTDPKGTLLPEIGTFLERKKYRIKCLNLINFRKSMRYNPLAYIRSEKDILKLVNALIMNTKGEGEKSSEDFWVKAERLYYSALIGYIWYEATEEEKNFITLLDLINASEAREDDETYQSPVDLLFSQLEEREPDHFAVKQYRKFKMAAGKTLKSILISCGARLAPFDIKELRDLMEYDELELDTLGDSKTALFVILSDTDNTFNFVAALMYSQLFNLLCDKADDFYGGRLPVHVRLILDEFANIGQIPNFDKLIATIRSREISASIILQSQSQLKTIYKDAADTIVGNCDSTLFLGGEPHKSTPKYYLLHILRKQNVSFLRKPFVKELVKDVNLPVLVLAFGTITNHDVLDKLQTSLTGKLLNIDILLDIFNVSVNILFSLFSGFALFFQYSDFLSQHLLLIKILIQHFHAEFFGYSTEELFFIGLTDKRFELCKPFLTLMEFLAVMLALRIGSSLSAFSNGFTECVLVLNGKSCLCSNIVNNNL